MAEAVKTKLKSKKKTKVKEHKCCDALSVEEEPAPVVHKLPDDFHTVPSVTAQVEELDPLPQNDNPPGNGSSAVEDDKGSAEEEPHPGGCSRIQHEPTGSSTDTAHKEITTTSDQRITSQVASIQTETITDEISELDPQHDKEVNNETEVDLEKPLETLSKKTDSEDISEETRDISKVNSLGEHLGQLETKDTETIMRTPVDTTVGVISYPQSTEVKEPIEIAVTPTPVRPGAPSVSVIQSPTSNLQVAHRKLYPSLNTLAAPAPDETLKPFTDEQLKTLYYNSELESLEEYVDEFLKHVSDDKHEFYELVLNYYRARNNLVRAEHDVNTLQQEAQQSLERVWTTREQTTTIQGKCADGTKVSSQHKYDQVTYHEDAWGDLGHTLKVIRGQVHDELSLHAYAAQLSRLQVESFIHDLYVRSPALCDLPQNSPIKAWLPQERDTSVSQQVAALRECVTILFMFQRKPAIDPVFVTDTRQWIRRLVATLLRLSTLEDHLWLLNQVLRCPPGVGCWAADLIQLASPQSAAGQSSWGSHLLDHCLAILATIMLPVREREGVLYQLQAAVMPSSDQPVDTPWIIVDSDGEEDEDGVESWHYLHENDLVSLLNQIPFAAMFAHVLLIEYEDGGLFNINQSSYDICCTSESVLLKLFAFASTVISVLRHGLHTFCLSRYRQFNKRIATTIRQVLQYVSDHWENYKVTLSALSPTTESRLQVEYDQVFYNATRAILAAQRLGSWQFMADMPYTGVSLSMMWKLVWLMHHWYKDGEVDVDTSKTPQQYKSLLEEVDLRQQFETRLMAMPTSEAIYLLTTFANMAASHQPTDIEFVETITSEIYEVAYLSSHTREFCSKVGRELLSSIALKHPFILSVLLQRVKETTDKIGMVSLYLFRELPLHAWRPLDSDLLTLRGWLLEEELGCAQHQLACLVYSGLNWGMDTQSGELFLPLAMHRQTAVLLVEVSTHHLHNKHMASLITDSVRQVASVVRSSVSPEQALCTWSWETALRLHLHALQQAHPVPASPTSGVIQGFDAPILSDDPKLHPILKSVQDKGALASYLALVMTKYGHTTSDVCSEGVELLCTLVEQGHHVAAVRSLSHITPLFIECPHYLTSSNRFMSTLQALIDADGARRGLLSTDFPGHNTRLFTAMIQCQISKHSLPPAVGSTKVILFWAKLLTHLAKWHQDRNVLYMLDHILAAAFRTLHSKDAILQFFTNINKQLVGGSREQGVLSSLVSWLATGNNLPSYLDGQSSADFPYFAYAVLNAETEREESTGLWLALQRELFNSPSVALEQALKKSAVSLKLEMTAASQRLCIFRWAHQALNTSVSHPLLPFIWQRFFLRYLGRLAPEQGLPQRGSVGEKFFESTANNSLMKQLKKRLSEAADYHHKAAAATSTAHSTDAAGGRQSPLGDVEQDDLVVVEGHVDVERRTFHESLVRLYQTMAFWLDEPRLHDPQLYLPALPPQYDAERLLTLFNNNQAPWAEFLDSCAIEDALGGLLADWASHTAEKTSHSSASSSLSGGQGTTATERILTRLRSHCGQQPPPSLVGLKAPVPEIHPTILSDKQAMLYALRSDLNAITDYARLFCQRVAKHVSLDCTYIELLPTLYRNEPTEIVLAAACTSTFNPTHRCKGPASLVCQYEAKKRAEVVGRKVDENRVEYKQLMIESLLPPAQKVCSAAVHVENAISSLIRLSQSLTSSSKKESITEIGSALFYHLATLISEDTKYYPPTRQFFSACIEVLGQEYIRNNPGQSQPLMQAVLQIPSLAGLLSPNFSPNASPHLFVTMYEDMITVPSNQGPEVAFTLLTKFLKPKEPYPSSRTRNWSTPVLQLQRLCEVERQVKFDVEAWLARSKPSLSQRAALVQVIGSALCVCGQEPGKVVALVFEVYRSHLQQVLIYQFPDHYGDVLRFIVNGSKSGELSPLIWADFLETLGCGVTPEIALSTPTVTPTTPSNKPFLVLSAKHTRETLEWLSSHYFTARVSSTEVASFGLYPRWREYVPYLATFLGYLARRTIIQTASVCKNGDVTPQQAVAELWKQVVEAFAPWMQPLDNSGQILSPWLDTDIVMATTMVGTFVDVVKVIHEEFEELFVVPCGDVLSLLWPYYVETLSVPGTPDHVLQVLHSQLRSLPWTGFHPDAQAMALMLQIRERHARSCFLFAGHVMTSVRWSDIIERIGSHEALAHIHATLFQLLIYMAKDTDILEDTDLPRLLAEAEGYNWSFLDAISYTTAVSWFLENCDPRCVIVERSAKSAVILRLLKTAAGFVHGSSTLLHPETPLKRVAYVRCYVKLLCRCSHLPDINPDVFAVIVTNLMTEIEAVIGTEPSFVCDQLFANSQAMKAWTVTVSDPGNQQQESLSLCSEVLATLNNLNPSGNSSGIVLTALLQWLESSPTSILLLPLVSGAGRTLASLVHMAQLVEASINAHFSTDVVGSEASGWAWVLAAVHIPDLAREDFLNECVRQGSYLTLFAYVLQQLPLSRSPNNEFQLMKALISWTAKARPRPENEGKILLWWGKIFELALRQLSFNTDEQIVLQALLTFTPALATLGEDKSSAGLWGAIGLGKRSQLSHRFRFIVRTLLLFLLAQMPSKAALRTVPNAAGAIQGTTGAPPQSPTRRGSNSSPRHPTPTTQSLHALSQLEALKTNKYYASFAEHIDWAVTYVKDPAHCIRDAPTVLVHLATQLYPEPYYLGLLRPQLI